MELIDGRSRWLELDTEESALAWFSDIEAALFSPSEFNFCLLQFLGRKLTPGAW